MAACVDLDKGEQIGETGSGRTDKRDWIRKYRMNIKIRKRQILILVIALTFLAIGMTQGGMRDVLHKAIMICYECIGIG